MPVALSSLLTAPLLRHASPEARARFAQLAWQSHHLEDALLWRTGDPASELTFIRRGLVQIIKPAASGPAATLGLFGPSECVGLVATLGPQRYPADAVVVSEEVDLLHLPADAFRFAMQREPALADAANHALVQASQMLLAKIDVLTAGEIPQRLATLFAHLAERFGDVFPNDELRIPVALSRTVLARLVGARSETVIRVLSRWERDGQLLTATDGFVVHGRRWLGELTASVH